MKIKKICSFGVMLALSFIMCFSLAGCSLKYREKKPSAADAATVLKVGEYSVSLELYRYLLLGYVDALYDSPDAARADSYKTAVSATEEALAGIYGIYELCDICGIATDRADIEEAFDEYIISIIDSYGSRREYLADLASINSSDSIFRFTVLTDLCEEALFNLLYADDNGFVDVTDEAVYEYMTSDDSFAYYMIELYNDGSAESRSNAEKVASLASAAGSAKEFRALYGYSIKTYADTLDGYIFYAGRGELEPLFEDEILCLATNETSQLIETESAYYIFRRAQKNTSDADGDSAFIKIKTSYVNFKMRELTYEISDELLFVYSDYEKLISSLGGNLN